MLAIVDPTDLRELGALVVIVALFLVFMWQSLNRMTTLAAKLSSQHQEALKAQSDRHASTLETIGDRCHHAHADIVARATDCIDKNTVALRDKQIQDVEMLAYLRRQNGHTTRSAPPTPSDPRAG